MPAQKIELTSNALQVLEKRYLLKDKDGKVIESAEGLFKRVARAIAQGEKNYPSSPYKIEELSQKFYELMVALKFLPNSPTLMNAGTPLGQLSACFVLPLEDSMEAIFETVKRTSIIHKTGGGTGFSFSRLRPKNDIVRTTGGVASGPVSFMKVFNAATEAVKQGGRRRGANMGILRVDHPDVIEFITCKEKEGELANFNISVALTDKFMETLEKNDEYGLINPATKKVVGKLKAREVFRKLVEGAWKNGEPGVIFIDRINRAHPLKHLAQIESTNPCGEQPLLPHESCNLGSINLAKFVKGDPLFLKLKRKATYKEAYNYINWDDLKNTVHLSVHFLDNVIDANYFPFEEIKQNTLANRKIGLGVMGFADLLLQLAIPYTSKEALKLADSIMKFISREALAASQKLGEWKGSFPNIKHSIYKTPIRNACLTTIAPTGTLSMIVDTSNGIEPTFALVYEKHVLDGAQLLYINKYFELAAKKLGFHSAELMKQVSKARSIKQFDKIPNFIREIFTTTFDVPPEHHVKMQAAFQKYVDNAVSKTINLPNSATVEEVEKAYLLAYKLKCKGITVYRDGSREVQVMNLKEERKSPGTLSPRSRPATIKGKTFKRITELGSLYVTVNEDEYGPFEIFVALGKSGSSSTAFTEAIARLISLAFRSGVAPRAVIKQLKGIKSSIPSRQEDSEIVFSVPDAIAKVLEKYLRGGEQLELPAMELGMPKKDEKAMVITRDVCPECGGVLKYQEGCYTCLECGHSKCD